MENVTKTNKRHCLIKRSHDILFSNGRKTSIHIQKRPQIHKLRVKFQYQFLCHLFPFLLRLCLFNLKLTEKQKIVNKM